MIETLRALAFIDTGQTRSEIGYSPSLPRVASGARGMLIKHMAVKLAPSITRLQILSYVCPLSENLSKLRRASDSSEDDLELPREKTTTPVKKCV